MSKATVFRFDRPGDRARGNDVAIQPSNRGLNARITGWCTPRPKVGHVLVLRGPNGGGSCYVVDSLDLPMDPPDMWFADCHYERDAVHP